MSGPKLYARGSIVVKLETYLNVEANLATFVADLQLNKQPSPAVVKAVVNTLSKAGLITDETKHLIKDYFTDSDALGGSLARFECYRVGFARAVEAAQNRPKGTSYQIDISWSCSQPDACAVNWSDGAIGRLIHVAIMAQVPGNSLQPTNKVGQPVPTLVAMPPTAAPHGFSLYYAASPKTPQPPQQWDLSNDAVQGNRIRMK